MIDIYFGNEMKNRDKDYIESIEAIRDEIFVDVIDFVGAQVVCT